MNRNSASANLLICWACHAMLVSIMGLAGLAMQFLVDEYNIKDLYEPLIGVEATRLLLSICQLIIDLTWPLLIAAVIIGVVTALAWARTRLGCIALTSLTWLHIVGLIPIVIWLHLALDLSGPIAWVGLSVELVTIIVTVVALWHSIKHLPKPDKDFDKNKCSD